MNNALFLVTLLSVSFSVTSSAAPHGHDHKRLTNKRMDFNKTVTRSTRAGTITRETQQRKTANGFTRTHRVTTPSGSTASRDVSVSYDPESRTRTREITGTRRNGNEYSARHEIQRTDSGFTRQSQHNFSDGTSTSRTVNAFIDKDANTITKNIAVTNRMGETRSRTVEKTYTRH